MRSREITQKTRLYALFFFASILTGITGLGYAFSIAPLSSLGATRAKAS
jgi:hypothetical protein